VVAYFGLVPSRLACKLDTDFAHLAVHKAKMKEMFRFLREKALYNYSVAQLTAVSRLSTCDMES
jgi:hypothetical protein